MIFGAIVEIIRNLSATSTPAKRSSWMPIRGSKRRKRLCKMLSMRSPFHLEIPKNHRSIMFNLENGKNLTKFAHEMQKEISKHVNMVKICIILKRVIISILFKVFFIKYKQYLVQIINNYKSMTFNPENSKNWHKI